MKLTRQEAEQLLQNGAELHEKNPGRLGGNKIFYTINRKDVNANTAKSLKKNLKYERLEQKSLCRTKVYIKK